MSSMMSEVGPLIQSDLRLPKFSDLYVLQLNYIICLTWLWRQNFMCFLLQDVGGIPCFKSLFRWSFIVCLLYVHYCSEWFENEPYKASTLGPYRSNDDKNIYDSNMKDYMLSSSINQQNQILLDWMTRVHLNV